MGNLVRGNSESQAWQQAHGDGREGTRDFWKLRMEDLVKNFVDNFLANIGWNWISQMFRTFRLVLDVFIPRKSRRKTILASLSLDMEKKM